MSAQEKPPHGSISVPAEQLVLTAVDTTHYSIRRLDWKRVQRGLNTCDTGAGNAYANAGWACIGIAASAGLTLPTLATIPDASRPAWMYPLYVIVTVAAVVVAVALLVMARDKARVNAKTIVTVRDDMKEIEDSFKSDQGVAR